MLTINSAETSSAFSPNAFDLDGNVYLKYNEDFENNFKSSFAAQPQMGLDFSKIFQAETSTNNIV